MCQKIFFLCLLTATLNTATATTTDSVGPTLTVRKTAEGMVVEAVRPYGGQAQRDTTGLNPEATSLGSQMFKLRFQECGEVKFTEGGSGRVIGIDAGRGATPQCQITNWDVQWKVLNTDR